MKRTKRYLTFLLSVAMAITLLSGCGGEEPEPEPTPQPEFSSQWEKVNSREVWSPRLAGDTLYYWNGIWDVKEKTWTDSVIYRRKAQGKAEEIAVFPTEILLCFTVDNENCLICLYSGEAGALTLEKRYAGQVRYSISLEGELLEALLRYTGVIGAVTAACDSEGTLCLLGMDGMLYFFDENGVFQTMQRAWEEEEGQVFWTEEGLNEDFSLPAAGLALAGSEGLYLYRIEPEGKALFQKVDKSAQSPGEELVVSFDSGSLAEVLGSGKSSILLSDGNGLYAYTPGGEEPLLLADYRTAEIGLTGRAVSCAAWSGEKIWVLAGSAGEGDWELLSIKPYETEDSPQKQIVSIGISGSQIDDTLQKLVSEFNRYSADFQIEIRPYASSDDLALQLIRGEGPDLISLENLQINDLVRKGILEDLSPYFAASEKVSEEDILPSIRRACTFGGKLCAMFPLFTVRGIAVQKGHTDNGAWTPEEYLSLRDGHSDAVFDSSAFHTDFQARPKAGNSEILMQIALYEDMDSFIDWENGTCSFDSERFISLMEKVKQAADTKTLPDIALNYFFRYRISLLHNGDLLTDGPVDIMSFDYYADFMDAYGDFAELAGYPSSDATPHYRLYPWRGVWGINSASACKEGAWAFLEYFLFEEYQETFDPWKGFTYFSVRRDVFELYAKKGIETRQKKREAGIGYYNLFTGEHFELAPEVTEKDLEGLLYIVDNAYWNRSMDDILKILCEEMPYYFNEDKTVAEAADIVQNRLNLMLME